MFKIHKVKQISAKEGNIRIDTYLARELGDFSRTFIQKLIKDKKITVNGKIPSVKTRINLNDEIKIAIPPLKKLELKAEKIPLKILYEDKQIIVINKPAGMVVHPAAGNYSGTLVNALLFHCKDLSGIGGVLRPGIVHRLDKDTSGVMVVAKTDKAHLSLARQFLEHKVAKIYITLVYGKCSAKYGKINVPLGRSDRDRKKMAPTLKESREAITFFKVLEEFNNFSLLEIRPKTGRTHQIRVHMAYIGYPVAGDKTYASKRKKCNISIKRQMLHAKSIKFRHPLGKKLVQFNAPLANDMKRVLEKLRMEQG